MDQLDLDPPTDLSNRPARPTERAADTARHRLLDGPILSTIARIAAPTVAVLAIQVILGLVELYFVAGLGTETLAGATLVFPLMMLMQMMSNGGVGAGVSSAVARAVGAGRRDDVEALGTNALALAVIIGLSFTVIEALGGHALFVLLGGQGVALETANTFSAILFGGAILFWSYNLLSAALRGAGETAVPAKISISVMVITTPLSPALIFGWGPFPRMGIAGAGLAILVFYALGNLLLFRYLRSAKSPLKLRFGFGQVKARLLGDILKVGAIAAVGSVIPNLALVIITGAVGRFGSAALAGFGLAARLDHMMIPILFGTGTAILAVVGAATGARNFARAYRAAWVGSFLGASIAGSIGIISAIFPEPWLVLFSSDPATIESGVTYLRTVGPFWVLNGMSMLLGMAAQGAGHATWPLLAGLMRLCVGAIGALLVVTLWNGSLPWAYSMVALGAVASCTTMIIVQLRAPKGRG